MIVVTSLLCFATLTISVPGRVETGLFQGGCFLASSAMVARKLMRRQLPLVTITPLLLCVPVLLGTLQLLAGRTVNPAATSENLLQWAAFASLALAASGMIRTEKERTRMLVAASGFGCAIAAACLLQPYIAGLPDLDKMAGPFQNRNTYASFVELLLPVVAWVAVHDERKTWLWWIGAAAMVASVVASGSRSGAAFVAAESILVLILFTRKNLAKTGAIAGILLLAIVLAGWDRLAPRLAGAEFWEYRAEIYASALNMIGERPLTGVGLGAFQSAYPRFATFDAGRYVNHAHNDWLEWTAEGGLAMPVALAAIWGIAISRSRRHPWALGIHFVFLHALVDYPMQRAGMAAWVWVFATILTDSLPQPHRTPAAATESPLPGNGPEPSACSPSPGICPGPSRRR